MKSETEDDLERNCLMTRKIESNLTCSDASCESLARSVLCRCNAEDSPSCPVGWKLFNGQSISLQSRQPCVRNLVCLAKKSIENFGFPGRKTKMPDIFEDLNKTCKTCSNLINGWLEREGRSFGNGNYAIYQICTINLKFANSNNITLKILFNWIIMTNIR